MQLDIIRKFIEKKTANAKSDDMILLVGDMNANGNAENKKAKSYRDHLKENGKVSYHTKSKSIYSLSLTSSWIS